MKRPVVFSLLHTQSVFMTVIITLLTFMVVLTLGIGLSVGTAVMRWNAQWDLFATVQVMNPDNNDATKRILTANNDKMESVTQITKDQMQKLMSPWVSGANILDDYLPQMYEVKFKTKNDMVNIGKQVEQYARFLPHATALHASTSAGWKIMMIAGVILALTIGTIGACVIFIARNTALLHRRELEILNQIGARDSFVAHQMQIIVTKICSVACGIGFAVAAIVLMFILSAAQSARVGLMAMMGLGAGGWFALLMAPLVIIVFAIFITRKTTLKILQDE